MLDVVGYIIMGLILLMVPGFLFSTVLYPKRENLDFWARMGVSLGLGTMVAVIVGYAISLPGVSTLSLGPFVVGTVGVCIVLGILTYVRGGVIIIIAYKNGMLKILHRGKTLQEPQTKALEQPKPATTEQPQTKTPEEPKTT